MEKIIWKIVRQLTAIFPDEIIYGYKFRQWWMVSVSSFEVYRSERYKKLTSAWSKITDKSGEKVIFSCCNPSEKDLVKLLEDNNLIMEV